MNKQLVFKSVRWMVMPLYVIAIFMMAIGWLGEILIDCLPERIAP